MLWSVSLLAPHYPGNQIQVTLPRLPFLLPLLSQQTTNLPQSIN